jgi:hypothetical protein
MKTQYEVELDTYRYELHSIRQQLKKFSESIGMEDLYHICEQDIHRLSKENKTLREANLQLEIQLLDRKSRSNQPNHGKHDLSRRVRNEKLDENGVRMSQATDLTAPTSYPNTDDDEQEYNHASDKDEIGAESDYIAKQHRQELQRLLKKLKHSGQEREYWKQISETYKQKERQFHLQEKLLSDCNRRYKKLFMDHQQLKKKSEDQSRLFLSKDQEVQILQENYEFMEECVKAAEKDRDNSLRELQWYKQQYEALTDEKQRMKNLHKFIEKHANQPMSVGGKGMQLRGREMERSESRSSSPTPSHRAMSPHPPPPPPSSVPTTSHSTSSSMKRRTSSPYPLEIRDTYQSYKVNNDKLSKSPRVSGKTVASRGATIATDSLPRGYSNTLPHVSFQVPLATSSQSPSKYRPPHLAEKRQSPGYVQNRTGSIAKNTRDALLESLQESQRQQQSYFQRNHHHEMEDSADETMSMKESRHVPDIDSTVSALHHALLKSNPNLLPLVSKLSEQIHEDRCQSVVDRSGVRNRALR